LVDGMLEGMGNDRLLDGIFFASIAYQNYPLLDSILGHCCMDTQHGQG
jgi:hypothetical protein